LSIAQPAKVAMPATTVTVVVVHDNTAPAVPVPDVIANVTCVEASDVIVLPDASWIATFGWVPNTTPTFVEAAGWVVNPNFDAAAAFTVTVGLTARFAPPLKPLCDVAVKVALPAVAGAVTWVALVPVPYVIVNDVPAAQVWATVIV
jgi:hypothetical protein